MALPRIQYVTTSDGVRIAYSVHGRGPAILSMPPLPFRHVELEWKLAGDSRWLERLAQHHTVIQYDPRGLGLSDRRVTSYTYDALERDIDAVVQQVAPSGVALYAAATSGAVAMSYAAHHPQRVSHLVLWCTAVRPLEGIGPQLEALLGLVDRDWQLFTETTGHVLRGWSAGEDARQFAAVLRAAATPEAVRALIQEARDTDVTALLTQIRSPTLVLHRRDLTWVPIDAAVQLAAHIPDARLVILDGNSMAPWAGDMEAAARAMEEFLGTAVGSSVAPPSDGSTFRCEGEYWTVSFAGRVARVRDAKGLHHIAYLLARPGEAVSVVELLNGLDRDAASVTALGDAGPMLDSRAKAAYRRRIDDLRTELAEAETFNDTGRAAAARAEIDDITTQLAAAVGRGGRDRKASSVAERARLTVTKRIRDAIQRVQRVHSELGAHLTRAIQTGAICRYAAGDATRWSL